MRATIRSLTSRSSGKPGTMPQVEVDEPNVQERLGKMQMDFVRKAERQNLNRAIKHREFRTGDWTIAIICITLAVSIYSYTIYAIKQETFLDDFEMPDELAEAEREAELAKERMEKQGK